MEHITKHVDLLFADVRTAHRLIFEYQKRVLDLIFYIKGKFNFSKRIGGYKRFSYPISKIREYSNEYPEANLNIFNSMWAWDFLYSYMMEFYFGEITKNKHAYCMSIIEISDTGYYSSRQPNKDKQDIQTFANIDDSDTLLIFVFELTVNNEYKFWDTSCEKINEWILSTNTYFKHGNKNDAFLIMKVPLRRLINKNGVDIVISEFNNFVKEATGIDLMG